MRVFGWVLFVLGIALLGLGFVYPPPPVVFYSENGKMYMQRYHNKPYDVVLQERSNFIFTGGFLAVCGAICINRRRRE